MLCGRGGEVPELASEGRMVFGEYNEADFREEGACDSRAHLSCNPLATVIGKLRVCPDIFREYNRCKGLDSICTWEVKRRL